jgi:hypothetical protein
MKLLLPLMASLAFLVRQAPSDIAINQGHMASPATAVIGLQQSAGLALTFGLLVGVAFGASLHGVLVSPDVRAVLIYMVAGLAGLLKMVLLRMVLVRERHRPLGVVWIARVIDDDLTGDV